MKTGKKESKVSIIAFVIPCYNEEEVLPISAKELLKKIQELITKGLISDKSRIYFVDDGSKDSTWSIIQNLNATDIHFSGIKLAGNKGHQNALLCGLLTVCEKFDAAISLDADLQDDINSFDEMIEKFNNGIDIVYGVRSSRKKDSFFKRSTAQSYYKLLNKMGGKIIYNHADYRLMSKRAIEALSKYHEVNLFLRGLVPMLGFKSDCIYYSRKERKAGTSKYPLKKMISFAIQGITSLSVKPLQIITQLGIFIFLISLCLLVYFLIRHFTGHTVQGWTTLAVSIWALCGLIQISIGVLGEYIGKIYLETKNRPRYIIEKVLDNNSGEKE